MTNVAGGLARVGFRGAVWQGLALISGKGIVLLTTIVLARLLSPEQYGLVAAALVLMAYMETIADAGVAQALVYLPASGVAARSALLVSVVLGAGLAVLAIIAAPWIGGLFQLPDVEPLVRVLAISLLATALGAVPEALLRRDLQFKKLAVAPVCRALTTGAVSLTLAFAGYGAFSLAAGTASGSVAYAATCWFLIRRDAPWQLWRVAKDAIRATLKFGVPVAGSNLLARLIFDIDYVIIASVLGAQALGYYTLAFRLPEALIINVFFVLSTVLFPLYTQVQDQPGRLREGYLKGVRIQSLYGMTSGVGLAVLAPVIVPLVFGSKWSDSVVPLVFLSLYAAARSLGAGANDVYKAIGRPGLSITFSSVRLAVLVPVLILSTQWGIVGVACAQMATAVLFAFGMQAVAARVLGIGARALLRAILPALACSLAVVLAGLEILLLPYLGGLPTAALVLVTSVAAVYLVLRLGFASLHDELVVLLRRR
ncbi:MULTISPECIES: lipopolysaccharide biosynthesis protein [unclassified Arthrobacter]|uniref:lipopolysaccharide biosynthesis protein n=1 Tax=unclassified Arthrobacter TaxID=235627 RepID=UPI001C866336|nr:lipopolysaccharide biosynthesis protein [Arthrobacter sp. MAHUQ-56]MBX7443216.1 lipopolysaccharide biosynthesis protein [Arthrobacter sp. MAHUQ-56]